MDTFEPIRISAAGLHEELVSEGLDPQRPLELVEAACERIEVEIVWLAPGDPIFKGAKAFFDGQSGTICCERAGPAGEQALVVAHEIGHARIHESSSSCSGNDVDPSRSAESAPVGLQRVEDYGARERRELQANIFAREFLLPRSLARRLFLDDGLGASEIAGNTGLPINLVRQQLFDALLLPWQQIAESSTPQHADLPLPDPSQTRAAGHRGSPFQLQAGPGTGKTRTLVNRVLGLLRDGIDPAAILVLTFSNRAAGELAERIAAAAPESAPSVWIGTFHAFGLDLIRRYHDKLGLSSNPPLFDRSDAIELMEEILPTLPLVHYRNLWDPAMVLRDVVSAISRAKDEIVDAERYRALAEAMIKRAANDDEREAGEKCLEVATIYELYDRTLQERGAVDFGDLIMRPAQLLDSHPELCLEVRLRHRHVLVDEYQDVNRASARLLKAVAGDGKQLWVVGDSRQSIYRFRGASSTNMAAFSSEYAGAALDQLGVNYRSTQQIVNAFVSIAPRMGASEGMLPLQLSARRGAGTTLPEIRRYDTVDDEAAGIAASVRELEGMGTPLREQAVLCRTNSRLNEIAAALEARGIPVLHLGNLFEREEIRDLLAVLSLAVDPFGSGLVRIGTMPRYDLSLQDVYLATRQLTQGPKQPTLRALPTLVHTPGLSPAGSDSLARLEHDLAGLTPAASAWEFLSVYLLDRSGILREMASRPSVSDQMRAVAVWQFLNFVRDQSFVAAGLPIQRTLDRVRQLVLLAEERDLRQVPVSALHLDAVRLMTVHGSKGLEFEAVHIPGLTVASFPSSNRGQRCPPPEGMIQGALASSVAEDAKRSHDHEEQCLFFVALSRAQTHLRLYLTRLQLSGKRRTPSPFLDWINSSTIREVNSPSLLEPGRGRPVAPPVVVNRSTDEHVTDSQLIAYEKCPRRFLYTHVLGLGGARKATAFSRTHDCLYELIRWLADVRGVSQPSSEQVDAEFENIWQARGPVDHAFAEDYRRLASRLIAALIQSGAGHHFKKTEPIAIDLPNGRIAIQPNELAQLPNGAVVLRRVRTGYKHTDEYDRLDYTLYHLAGRARFGSNFLVEAVHLTDGVVETVEITEQKISNRRNLSDSMLAALSAGKYPGGKDAVTCPRCPHYFLCPAIPRGPLTLL